MKYHELYPDSLTLGIGIVTAISVIEDIPWNTLSAAEIMDLERAYALRSANKILVSTFAVAPPEVRERMICTFFKHKWKKLWDIHHLEYNSLDAYTVTEKGSKSVDVSNSGNVIFGKEVSDTVSDTGTVETVKSDTNTSSDSVYGFNSALPVPSTTGTDSISGKDTETRNLSGSHTIKNSGKDESSGTSKESITYEYDKKGNIGYSTPQKMLKEELSLWATPFFETVFDDIDSIITLSVYE